MSRVSAPILAVLSATQGESPCPRTRGAATNHIVPAIQAYTPIHTYVPTLEARDEQIFQFNISLTLAELVCLLVIGHYPHLLIPTSHIVPFSMQNARGHHSSKPLSSVDLYARV